MWTYRIVLPVFITLNITLGILNLMAFGGLTAFIAQTIADIIFSSLQIKYSTENYERTRNIKDKINNVVDYCLRDEILSKIINYGSPILSLFNINSSIININKVIYEKMLNVKLTHSILSNQFKISINIANISISILCLAFSITMNILESTLIKNYEL